MLSENFGISSKIIDLCVNTEHTLYDRFSEIDAIAEFNQLKVIYAMQEAGLSDIHFASSNGYGYNDLGRDTVERIYSAVFKCEDSLVRAQMVSGTHAITTALFGNLRPGDEMLSPNGKPYDTLDGVIGLTDKPGSLKEFGVSYRETALNNDGSFNYAEIKRAINERTRLVTIQRSKGYCFRKAITIDDIKTLIRFIKNIDDKIICMVDNCYGEFVNTIEPTEVGADIVCGSLIKNIGGGIAPVGGYVAGKREYVENAACRLTSPALGKGAGPSLGLNLPFLQGLFLAPSVVGAAMKGALLSAAVFKQLDYEIMPGLCDKRSDIVQAIRLNSPEGVSAFCEGVQKASPVDSHVKPVAAYMPGYDHDVIMAAGAFVQGSSIELSADAPIVPPYNVYYQGGLSYIHSKIGLMMGLQKMADIGLI